MHDIHIMSVGYHVSPSLLVLAILNGDEAGSAVFKLPELPPTLLLRQLHQ